MKVYHVTPSKNIPNIQKEGLLITKQKNVPISKKNVNYVMKDKLHAGFFASKMNWEMEEPVSIVHVKVNKSKLQQDLNTGATIGSWYEYPQDIQKEQIVKIEPWDERAKRIHKGLMTKRFK